MPDGNLLTTDQATNEIAVNWYDYNQDNSDPSQNHVVTTLASSSPAPIEGSSYLRVTVTAVGAEGNDSGITMGPPNTPDSDIPSQNGPACVAGTAYRSLSMWQSPTATMTVTPWIDWWTGVDGSLVSSDSGSPVTLTGGTWHPVNMVDVVAPVSATVASLRYMFSDTSGQLTLDEVANGDEFSFAPLPSGALTVLPSGTLYPFSAIVFSVAMSATGGLPTPTGTVDIVTTDTDTSTVVSSASTSGQSLDGSGEVAFAPPGGLPVGNYSVDLSYPGDAVWGATDFPGAATLTVVAYTGAEGPNLLGPDQADFEGGIGGWVDLYALIPGGTPYEDALVWSTEQAKHGTHSLKVTVGPASAAEVSTADVTSDGSHFFGGFDVTPGHAYTILGSFRSEADLGDSPNAEVHLDWVDDTGTPISSTPVQLVVATPTEWAASASTGIAPDGAVKALLLIAAGTAPGQAFYVDEVSFAEGDSTTWTVGTGTDPYTGPEGPNLLTPDQASFDSGPGWQDLLALVPAYQAYVDTVEWSTEQAQHGTHSLKVTIGGAGAGEVIPADVSTVDALTWTGGIPVEAGHTYTFLTSFRSPLSNGPTGEAALRFVDTDGAVIGSPTTSNQPGSNSSEWKPAAVTSVAPDGAARAILTLAGFGPGGHAFYVGQVSFAEGVSQTWTVGTGISSHAAVVADGRVEWSPTSTQSPPRVVQLANGVTLTFEPGQQQWIDPDLRAAVEAALG